MISHYDWAGGREAMLRFGPVEGPVVIAALPLFEEANRTRAFAVTILRGLTAHGIGGALPDLPGTGESLVPVEVASLADWRGAFAAAAASLTAEGREVHALSIRGGALVESEAEVLSRWQISPCTGEGLVREMFRAFAVAEPRVPLGFDPAEPIPDGPPVELAGNRITRALLIELTNARPRKGTKTRVALIGRDREVCDLRFDTLAPWRRAEPDNDPALAVQIAAHIAEWVHLCAG